MEGGAQTRSGVHSTTKRDAREAADAGEHDDGVVRQRRGDHRQRQPARFSLPDHEDQRRQGGARKGSFALQGGGLEHHVALHEAQALISDTPEFRAFEARGVERFRAFLDAELRRIGVATARMICDFLGL